MIYGAPVAGLPNGERHDRGDEGERGDGGSAFLDTVAMFFLANSYILRVEHYGSSEELVAFWWVRVCLGKAVNNNSVRICVDADGKS